MVEAWTEVCVRANYEAAEAVAEMLRPFAFGQTVAVEQLWSDGLLPWETTEVVTTNPPSEIRVKIYYPASQDSPQLRQEIEAALQRVQGLGPVEPPEYGRLEDEDWATAWKAHYHPIHIGRRIRIEPSWEASEAIESDAVVIRLDPGMAFGTGTHATTQLCLELLEERVQPGMRMLDVGTGSGILAIAAAKLGAGQVLGTDSDPLAVDAAQANVAENEVASRVRIVQGTLPAEGAHEGRSYDLVVVNILAPVIERLLSEENLLSYAAGPLIVSGFVAEQEAGVRAAIAAAGGVVTAERRMEDWVALVAESVRRKQ